MDSQDSVNHGTQAILNCLYEPLSRECDGNCHVWLSHVTHMLNCYAVSHD